MHDAPIRLVAIDVDRTALTDDYRLLPPIADAVRAHNARERAREEA